MTLYTLTHNIMEKCSAYGSYLWLSYLQSYMYYPLSQMFQKFCPNHISASIEGVAMKRHTFIQGV